MRKKNKSIKLFKLFNVFLAEIKQIYKKSSTGKAKKAHYNKTESVRDVTGGSGGRREVTQLAAH